MKRLFLIALFPSAVFAADPNFLTPADLPAKAEQVFMVRGRGTMPDFADGYGIDLALRENAAHRTCMRRWAANLRTG